MAIMTTKHKPYPTYRPTGVEWLGEIPAHWEMRRLKFAARIEAGQSPPSAMVSDNMNRLPFLQGNAEFGPISPNPRFACEEAPKRARAGDILLSIRAPVGAINVADQTYGIGRGLCAIQPYPDLGGRFAYYLLIAIRSRLSEMATGSTYDAVTAGDVGGLAAILPPLPEQRAIAAFLDRETAKIDSLVTRKERLTELLQEKRTALISKAVTKGLDPDVPMKDSGVDWLGEIPAHWQVMRLARITECLDGQRVPLNAEERSYMQGVYPYWGANSIVDYIDRWLFDEELVLIGEDGAPFFDPNREVAFTVSGKVWVNNHAHVLRPRPQVQAQFLSNVLNCVDYAAFIDGTTRDKLTQGDMNVIPVQVPPLVEQREIASYLDSETTKIDALVAKMHEAIEHLKELHAALISAAVTGRIDVREEVA